VSTQIQSSLGRQVALSFGALCALLAALGGLLFFGLRGIERGDEIQQARVSTKLAAINDAAQDIGQMQTEILREVLASAPAEISELDRNIRALEQTNIIELAGYEKFLDSDSEKVLYSKMRAAQALYWEKSEPVMELARADRDAEAIRLINSGQASAYDALFQSGKELFGSAQTEADVASLASVGLISKIRIMGDIILASTILLLIWNGIFIVKLVRRLKVDNSILQAEIAERHRTEASLREKTALFEGQLNSTIDGVLLIDSQRKMVLQNQRLVELFDMPPHIASEEGDENRLRWAIGQLKNPDQFIEKVNYLYAHPDELSRDEVELKDGVILDRYSAPVVGHDGTRYGRIWGFRDVTKQKQAERKLRDSEEKFRQLAENIADVFWITSPDLREMYYVSPAYEKIWGRTAESLYADPHQWVEAVLPEERKRVITAFASLMNDVAEVSLEYPIARPDGEVRWIHDRGFQVRDETGKLIRLAGIASDITNRKRIEAQMVQSQRLETVGKLAGGVAHEFNSILTAIIGQSELMLYDLPADSRLTKGVMEIRNAAERAATLTHQLLAYGRKQILQPQAVNLNQILQSMEGTLRHLAGKDVDVRIIPSNDIKMVRIDPGQIEQVIINIAMNAAAVMPNGGKLTLETADVTLDEDYVSRFPDLKAGDYVMLAITDTGRGISPDVKKHLFEPFFTTKPVGQGTGLGLATCYGIVKQSNGHISAYSELSRGATFRIYLPQVEPKEKKTAPAGKIGDLPRGTETILLVEDDPSLREIASTVLKRLGYAVLTAADGVEALNLKHQRNVEHVDLVFTDVVMPHMTGKELSERFKVLYPRTKVLFTSAYTENAIVHQGVLDPGVTLLPKPFTPSALAAKVREVLDRDEQAAPA
jgi:PAS domain S-box-containing protein